MLFRAAVLASLVASASAMCAGDSPCSGHGTCGASDKCTCYRNWMGEDCSLRVCPFATSWNTVESVTGGATAWEHAVTECSSKGTCDRKSGECKCNDAYTGYACNRMKCDNDCNNRGVCQTQARYSGHLTNSANGYTGWDTQMIQKCICDPGFEGDSCESIMCPKGDDPMTLADTTDGSTFTAQVNEIATLTFAGTAVGTYTISYTDWRGAVWETWPLDANAGTAIEVKEALEALPNSAITSISVSSTLSSGVGVHTISYQSGNPGNQVALTIRSTTAEACNTAGCQPKFAGLSAGTVTYAQATQGTTEWATCSNRGKCDDTKGDCVCFSGFTGQACQIQTVIT